MSTNHVAQRSTPEEGAESSLRFPDFFILGAAKCGTTALYQYLCRHPDVFMSTPKEVNFFSQDAVYALGNEWYASLFSEAKPGQLIGEASTTYSRWPLYPATAERLVARARDARLIYLVRNPIDRLYSFYAHRMREEVTTQFEEFLSTTPEAVDSGRYMTQINQYLRFFPRERILVLFAQDLNATPGAVLERTRSFLGLSAFDFLASGPLTANEGSGKHFAVSTVSRALDRVKRVPGMKYILDVAPARARSAGFQWLANGPIGGTLRRRHLRKMAPLSLNQRRRIAALYREEIEQLEAFTGRELCAWK